VIGLVADHDHVGDFHHARLQGLIESPSRASLMSTIVSVRSMMSTFRLPDPGDSSRMNTSLAVGRGIEQCCVP
jgi:hypothetical protein